MTDLADIFLPPPPPEVPAYSLGTVTSAAPRRVRLDGETAAVDADPITLAPLAVGDRVWVQIHRRQIIVLGVVQN